MAQRNRQPAQAATTTTPEATPDVAPEATPAPAPEATPDVAACQRRHAAV